MSSTVDQTAAMSLMRIRSWPGWWTSFAHFDPRLVLPIIRFCKLRVPGELSIRRVVLERLTEGVPTEKGTRNRAATMVTLSCVGQLPRSGASHIASHLVPSFQTSIRQRFATYCIPRGRNDRPGPFSSLISDRA